MLAHYNPLISQYISKYANLKNPNFTHLKLLGAPTGTFELD